MADLNRVVHCHSQAGYIMPFLVRLIDLYSLVVLVAVILSGCSWIGEIRS